MSDGDCTSAAVAAPHHARCEAGNVTDLASTAFRIEEKRYKLYKADPKAPKALRRRCDTDFTDVVDFKYLERNTLSNRRMIHAVDDVEGVECYTFSGVPGLLFFPSIVDAPAQAHWCHEALEAYTKSADFPNNVSTLDPLRVTTGYEPSLRWATLGFKYDWTQRTYSKDRWAAFPPELNALMCGLVERVAKVRQDAFCAAGLYESQTAIVNYFPTGSMMMAHQDISEVCLEKPLMSLSLGATAIFLMGTDNRNDTPHAFYLRSGDVVAFTGQARTAFHAVPRILDECPPHLVNCPSEAPSPDSEGGACPWQHNMRGLRININVRQVYDERCPFLFRSDAAAAEPTSEPPSC